VEDVGKFYGHLVYFMAIGPILWLFGIFYGYLVHFFPFWYDVSRKIWQPCVGCLERSVLRRNRWSDGRTLNQVIPAN
jgi:hypothetical protein